MTGQMSNNHAATCAMTPARQDSGQVLRIDRFSYSHEESLAIRLGVVKREG